MSLQNLRHNPLPSIWERPLPRRRLSREEPVQAQARVLRARVHTFHHPRRLRVLANLQPLFRQADKRAKARSRVLRQVRTQREKLPLGVWQAAVGHALNETEHPEDPGRVIPVPSAIEEDSEEDDDYDPAAKASSDEESSDEEEDLKDKEASDETKTKRKRNERRTERRVRREAARGRRLERKLLRFSPGDTDEEEAKLVREHEATNAVLAKEQALKDVRSLKKPKVKPGKRVRPTLLMKRIKPELVQSVELPSDDSEDGDYDPAADVEMGEEGEALQARIGEKAESEDEEDDASSTSDKNDLDDKNDHDDHDNKDSEKGEKAEAMDEDEDGLDDDKEEEKDTSLDTVDTAVTANSAETGETSMQSAQSANSAEKDV